MLLFNASYGRNTQIDIESYKKSKNEAVQDLTQRIKKVQEKVASIISKAQTEIKKYANHN